MSFLLKANLTFKSVHSKKGAQDLRLFQNGRMVTPIASEAQHSK